MNQELKIENPQSEIRNPQLIKRLLLHADEPKTLAELFLKAAEKHNRADALNFKKDGEWKSISSDEIIFRAENIALGLYSFGIKKGDRIALLAANSPEWTLTDAGCQFAGVIDAPVYTTLAPNAVEYIIKDAGAKVLFLENVECYERLKDVLSECRTLEKIIFFDSTDVADESAMSLTELENAGAKLKVENPNLIKDLIAAIAPSDVATLIYTSGTTGEPKGVMLTHSNLVSNVLDAGAEHAFSPNDKPLSVLPFSHVFERTGMYLYIINGMAVYYAESIERAADNLIEVAPTMFVAVPRIFEKVYARAKVKAVQEGQSKAMIFDWAIDVGKQYALLTEQKQPIPRLLAVKHSIADRIVFSKLREFFGGNLSFCISGGAALSDDIHLIFTGAGIAIMQGYGLTETSPVVTTNTGMNTRLGTVGKPIRNVQVRIASDGEIEVSGANVMLGYYNKPEATREAFTDDGWFKTGDIGTLDADGFLKITDRKKELFKTSGGKYIAPSPIEQLIKASRFVSQVVLVGSERNFPAALVVPNFEQLENYAKIKNLDIKSPAEFCTHPRIIDLIERQIAELTKNLSHYEKVKKIALLENELTVAGGELTPTLKVKRRVVDEKYHEIIEKIYSDTKQEKS
ncbi:MAG: long-chain fatty acid--CoA ligase [Acidobacteriota bacterium]|nr:long-chain fatty acid--CoA ligase [Acidobacteriota bacterium]